MNNLLANYERILEVLRKISTDTLLIYQRRRPKLFDLELLSLVLTAEFKGIDSENHLFRNLPIVLSVKLSEVFTIVVLKGDYQRKLIVFNSN